jgi:hypothetical protein
VSGSSLNLVTGWEGFACRRGDASVPRLSSVPGTDAIHRRERFVSDHALLPKSPGSRF